VLKSNKLTQKIFKGVYALDELPKQVSRPSILVVNTDTSDEKGMHWLGLFVPV